ncbi:hypothetical protein SEPCBS57363_002195 [Sporothrix epigloea]|uniref:C2h2 finger domain containing protein n=1 Tax=Sporothrix epigloea TaxID=1892477 RepID=A0ABP0DEK5_9PEZI
MGKKRRNYPSLEELMDRAWCYYCERDFEDLKLLISHQKAKHFKCERCGRRLNTAGGLSVHMNQVHKETLTQVENALEGREGLDVEIFGMEGIPGDALMQHNQQIVEDFHKKQADRQAATGNPPPGQQGSQRGPLKKIKLETAEELKTRLAAWRLQAQARQQVAAADTEKTQQLRSPHDGRYHQYLGGSGGLPQRPGAPPVASTLDDLVSGASHVVAGGDDIDRVIRMAEAGIRPNTQAAPVAAAATTAPEKSSKKDKSTRMVYQDGDFSLEEKISQMARYAVAV